MFSNTLPPRSIFATMPLTELIQGARQYGSRVKYLTALGFKRTRQNYGLDKRMEAEGLTLDDLWPNRRSADVRFPEPQHMLDLTREDHAYFYGLALADGHLQANSRNRGKLTIGLKSTDRGVLERIQAAIPWKAVLKERTRTTNFGLHTCCELVYHSRGLRAQLIALGFPTGKKSHICTPPATPHHERGFWRGFIDGDGSLGSTAQGYPFFALITTSDKMAVAYKDIVLKITGKVKLTQPNARDHAYNITVYREDAMLMASTLYPEGCLALDRKMAKAKEVAAWVRPISGRPMRIRPVAQGLYPAPDGAA